MEALVLTIDAHMFCKLTSTSDADRSQSSFQDGRFFRKTRSLKTVIKKCLCSYLDRKCITDFTEDAGNHKLPPTVIILSPSQSQPCVHTYIFSFYLFMYLFIHLSIYLSMFIFIYLTVYIYMYITIYGSGGQELGQTTNPIQFKRINDGPTCVQTARHIWSTLHLRWPSTSQRRRRYHAAYGFKFVLAWICIYTTVLFHIRLRRHLGVHELGINLWLCTKSTPCRHHSILPCGATLGITSKASTCDWGPLQLRFHTLLRGHHEEHEQGVTL